MLRELESEDADRQIDWLFGDTWPSTTGDAGFDPVGQWPAALWILHAVYEMDALPDDLTYDDLEKSTRAAGLEEPPLTESDARWAEVTEGAVVVGGGSGYAEKLDPPWRRLSWADLDGREGFAIVALSGESPNMRSEPRSDWSDPAIIPIESRPILRPIAGGSWPVSLEPPTEGSLDEESLLALTEVLTRFTAPQAPCMFYSGFLIDFDKARVYEGVLGDLMWFVGPREGRIFTPSNFWPADRSWFVYTDYDLCATRVSGSPELIDALSEADGLDTLRCG